MSRSQRAPVGVWAVCLTVTVALRLGGGPLGAEETPAERRARIERMDPAAKAELLRARERFDALDPAEQKRLHALNEKIEAHPRSEELLEVMGQYCEWVNTLSVYDRDALREVPPDQRIEKIKQLREDQANRKRAWQGGRGRFGGERLQGAGRVGVDPCNQSVPCPLLAPQMAPTTRADVQAAGDCADVHVGILAGYRGLRHKVVLPIRSKTVFA